MARRKIKEVEESCQATENSVNKKLSKVADIKPRRQPKRKINECENSENASEPNQKKVNQKSLRKSAKSEDLDDEEISSVYSEENTSICNKKIKNNKPIENEELLQNGEVVQSKKLPRSRSKKPAESKNAGNEREKVGNKRTVIEQKKTAATKKKASQSETAPKIKKAKVVLDKLDLDQSCKDKTEQVSADSISNSMIPVSQLKSENDTSIMATLKSTSQSLKNSAEASSSEEEWEEVEDSNEPDLDDYKPDIPKEGVEITIDCPDLKLRKRKKNQFDWRDWVRLNINRQRKECQLNIHKTHLLCLLGHGFYVNNILNSPMLRGVALSVLPSDMVSRYKGKKVDKIDRSGIEDIVKWFRSTYSFGREKDSFLDFADSIVSYFENNHSLNASEYNLMFVVLARTLGFKTRFCISLYALTHKAQNLIQKSRPKKEKQSQNLADDKKSDQNVAGPSEVKKEKPQTIKKEPKDKKPKKVKERGQKPAKVQTKNSKDSGSNEVKAEKRSRPKRSTEKSYKVSETESEEDKDEEYAPSEEDFQEQKPKRKSLTKASKLKDDRKVLSSESSPSSPEVFKGDKITCWAEVFSKPDKQWISIECVNNIVNEPYRIEESLPQPVTYIVAFDSDSHVKDVTRRYCSDYMTSTIKLRPDSDWWEEALLPFSPPDSKLDKEEEKNLESLLINKPLPKTVAGFKNHPLYALKRHLLKFEGIYPPDAKPVGFMRGEPVYPRECVCQLHSRETWLKEARVVRIGEEPYKIVKARPKWDRIAGVMRTDLPLEIFGFWQTKPYEPPTAVDGKVPRNEYGNVELFKPCMLPKGTVHLQLPGLNRIAKKLGIDCSPAVVGFDGHKGSVHAVFDGFIICEEFKDTIIAAWDEEQVNAQKREEEKREKRIYGNWKKLIRGLLIRERIKLKYDTK